MAMRVKLVGQILAVGVVAGLLAILSWRLANGSHVAKGAAPRFDLPRLNGDGKITLASLRGKAVVLNFWASWCVPCKQEAHVLESGWQRWKDKDVVFVGVDSQDFAGDARGFMRHFGITYPVVSDGPGGLSGRYGVTGFPETFFIDRRGKIVGQHDIGPVTAADLNVKIGRALKS
jgi:cytochrome c biogenesis protein CcmG/thiol:disulfide interchange protein DsbE